MQTTLVTAGVVCVIAAIVGGSLTAFGIKVPGVKSLTRQVLLATFGLAVGGLGIYGIDDGSSGGGGGPGPPEATDTGRPTEAASPAPSPPATALPPPDGTASPAETSSPVPADGPSPLVREGPWSATESGLTVTVERVIRHPDGQLELVVLARNATGDSLSLPLFGNFVARDDRDNAYEADPFASDWPEEIPAGASLRGSIMLEAPVAAEATALAIHFSTVFGRSGPDSIGVEGIVLP